MLEDIEELAQKYTPKELDYNESNSYYLSILYKIDKYHNINYTKLHKFLQCILEVDRVYTLKTDKFMLVYFRLEDPADFVLTPEKIRFDTTYRQKESSVILQFCKLRELTIEKYNKLDWESSDEDI